MDVAIQTIIDGLVLGSGYTLLALGFALVYSISGVLNVAHAEFFMVGAYTAVFTTTFFGGALLVALPAAILVTVVLGALLHLLVLRNFTTEQHLPAFVATIGVAFFLQFGMARVASPRTRFVPPLIPNTYHDIGPMTISNAQLLVVATTGILVAGLMWWIRRTSMGRQIRAVAESEEIAAVLGVRVGLIKLITLMTATAMAGIAGVLLGNLFGAASPFMGVSIALKMFVVVLVAGVGSVGGPVVVGLGLGVVEALSVAYVGSAWQHFAGMVALFIVLLLRPQGLFGRRVRAG